VDEPVRICFVCWGNICRSPTAEGIMRALVAEAGLADRVVVNSAGTSSDELGSPVDPRAQAEAQRRGLLLSHTAWRFEADDFDRFDLVVAAAAINEDRLRQRARTPVDRGKLRLLRSHDQTAAPHDLDVPDPWYGGADGFVLVYDLIEAACRGLLDSLRADNGW
jgi:protein-tyrosine phosphatase